MGREIKFRMWNNVSHDNSKSKYFYDVEVVMECLKQQINFNNGKSLRFEHSCYDHVGDGSFFEQFTGLTDKKGKDIYEGDKFNASDVCSEYYLVIWNEKEARFQIDLYGYNEHTGEGGQEVIDSDISLCDENCVEMSYLSEMEVIGNIHENPDLL